MSFFKSLFIEQDQNRLRSGWRVAYFMVLFFSVYFVVSLITAPFTFNRDLPAQTELLISSLPLAIGLTLITWVARTRIDQRSLTSLGISFKPPIWRELGFGLGIGAGLMGLIFLVQWAAGWLVVEGSAFETGLSEALFRALPLLILFLLVGYYEELTFRGYVLQNLVEGVGLTWGLVISSILFGGLHLINPNPSWLSLAGVTGAGLLMAYGWIATGRLWLSIGLHIAWNFFEGAVFGFPVSGIEITGLLRLGETGPDWLTGGAFGPEGGLIILPAMALGALAIWWYKQKSCR